MAAAASSAEAYGAWAYLVVFALMALTFVGAGSLAALFIGLAIAAGCTLLAARYYRRRRARRLLRGAGSPGFSEGSR